MRTRKNGIVAKAGGMERRIATERISAITAFKEQPSYGRRFLQVAVSILAIAILKAVFSTGNDRSQDSNNSNANSQSKPTPREQHIIGQSQSVLIAPEPAPTEPSVTTLPAGKSPTIDLELEDKRRREKEELTRADLARQFQLVAEQNAAAEANDKLQHNQNIVQSGADPAYQAPSKTANDLAMESHPVESRGYFTVGSTRDEVVAAQGTPTEFSDDVYHYGGAFVRFVNGRVSSWKSNYPELKAKLIK